MSKALRVLLVSIAIGLATVGPAGPFDVPVLRQVGAGTASAQGSEEPLDPVVGRDRAAGDTQDRRSYALLSILALCLIGAGFLLVKLERWERKRSQP